MRILNGEATAALLPYSALADSLLAMLRDKKSGKAYAPDRLIVPLPAGSTLLVMPAADEQIAITKLVTFHPDNHLRGLPAVQADVLVMDAASGERLVMLNGDVVTARRTAALSLLAARRLAPNQAGPLLVQNLVPKTDPGICNAATG